MTLFEEDDPTNRPVDYYTFDYFTALHGDSHWQRARYVNPIDTFPEFKAIPQIREKDSEQPFVLDGKRLRINFNR